MLHAADSPEHAVGEALATYRAFGLPLPADLHLVVRAVHVDLRDVLDLRVGAVRRALRVSESRMLDVAWRAENAAGKEAVSQAVGRAAADAGFGGLVVRSAAVPGGLNVVVFVDRLGRSDRLSLGSAE